MFCKFESSLIIYHFSGFVFQRFCSTSIFRIVRTGRPVGSAFDGTGVDCARNIRYRISGYEYPVGYFNYEDNEIHDGQFLEKPNGIVYQVEFDEESIASFLP